MRPFSVLLALFYVLIISSGLRAQQKKFRHFTATDGLSYNTIFDIDQDPQGFIWIATGEGLNRYDSYGFKQYYADKTPGSIPSNEVRTLLITGEGRLLVGTSDGICIFNPEYDNFTPILFDEQSLGRINDIFETANGKIIINSEKGAFIFPASECEQKIINLIKLPLERDMLQIQQDSHGNFWSFKRQRLFYFNEKGQVLMTYYVNPAGLPQYVPSAILSIKIDSHGQLFIGTFKDGPILFNNGVFRPIPLNMPPVSPHPMYFIHDIAEDQYGKYWISTEKGLFIYDKDKGNFEHYKQSFDPTLSSLNDNAIYKVFRSHENIMWIGTYFGGLNYWEPFETGFKKIVPGIKDNELKGKALSQAIEGPDDKIWIATEDAGIAIFDKRDNTFTHILNDQGQKNQLISHNVHALALDKEGFVWSGNFYGGINKINPKNYQIQNYSHVENHPESLVNNFVFALYSDPDDVLWVGTMDGIDCFDKKQNRIIHFKPEVFGTRHIYDIFQDRQDNYWFCTYTTGLYCYNKQTDKIIRYQKDSTENLNSNSFISHCIDSRGKIWFGTRDGGLALFDPATAKFKTYDMKDGLPNNDIYGILEDDQHNLWLSSNKGISKFNYLTGAIRNFTVDHGLVGNQFNFKSYLKTGDGKMYFGTVNGLCYFNPDQIKYNESKPKVHFTNFRLFNEPVKPAKNSVLEKDINFTDKIILKSNQNVISFDFIALDYHSMGKNNFFYYMDGFESTWQSAGNQRSISYTDLPPGDYTFFIKATNNYDFPHDGLRSIKITVLPPLFKTIWAYGLYFILLVVLLYLFYRFSEIRHQEKMSVNIQRIEKEKLQEIHQHKINFFTYISHEFKTPLTIIIASIDAFFSGEQVPNELKSRMIPVKRNVLRLQFLLNQLMDFRKIETDHETINLQEGDIIAFLREIFNAFATLFKKKELEYIFIPRHESLHIKFDPDKIEKIVSNLLSNAFKYTPGHGQITFRVDTCMEDNRTCLLLTVSDTGDGMTDDQLGKIFRLFYKIEDNQQEYPGSGIGLTLTQSLVKFLNGNITVESKPGTGTSFTVKLPIDEGSESVTAKVIQTDKSIIDNLLMQLPEDQGELQGEECKADFEILLVEDNKDLLTFLCDHFRKKYKIKAVMNGLEAINSVQKNVPDLIVTDLMMPHMDGLALCKALKSNFEYSHIPIIMLTAKTDIDTRLESLEVGADVYLPKPFLVSELDLYIKNILLSKSNLKQHFVRFGNLMVDHPIKNRDQQFIERITGVILKNIGNSDFGVTNITTELGIGRTLLHTKLKQILDLSTTEFINAIRIREAQKLLIEKPELTMSEVAYKVGFNDPNYFSRTFKKAFNISPTDFRNDKSKPEPVK